MINLTGNSYRLKIFVPFLFLTAGLLAQNDISRPLPQFLFPGFADGVVKSKSGDSHTLKLNYSMPDEKMVSELNGVYRILANTEDIDTIILQGRKFVPVSDAFYELVAGGPVPFFIQHKCYLKSTGSTVGYGVRSQGVGPTDYRRFELGSEVVNIDLPPDNTVDYISYNWVRKDGEMEKISNERQIRKLFPEHSKQIEDYFRSNDVNFKSSDDMAKLGTFCNDLLKTGK